VCVRVSVVVKRMLRQSSSVYFVMHVIFFYLGLMQCYFYLMVYKNMPVADYVTDVEMIMFHLAIVIKFRYFS